MVLTLSSVPSLLQEAAEGAKIQLQHLITLQAQMVVLEVAAHEIRLSVAAMEIRPIHHHLKEIMVEPAPVVQRVVVEEGALVL